MAQDPASAAGQHSNQPALLDSLAPQPAPQLPAGATEDLPVAEVLLESAVPHLDRPFDYVVPIDLAEKIVPGCRVKLRFSGREMTGYVLRRKQEASTASRLSLITKLVTALPVLSEDILSLAQQVAERGAGVTADVLRAAIPPRAARVEKEYAGLRAPTAELDPENPRPRSAALALKSYGPQSWTQQVLERVQDCLAGEGDAVVVVPDQRDVETLMEALTATLGSGIAVQLTAEMGPSARYRSFLDLRYGQARVAVGTRSAVFAPVARLRLLVVFEDGEQTHAAPRAPYHHVREVALLRTVQTGAELVMLSTSRSLEVQRLVERGWLAEAAPEREERRRAAPRMIATVDSYEQEREPAFRQARLPAAAYKAARDGLQHGPVLIQVARSGFIPAVLCERCRSRQQCPQCHGPLSLPAHHGQSRTLKCRWCGLHHRNHRCTECGSTTFRAGTRGADRTAQELGRAFPNTPVISSTSDHPIAEVGQEPALVVSTPGVEPVAETGYATALLLDGDTQLSREGLDVPRQVLSRWFRAASLVRPHKDEGGTVVITADAEELTATMVRWDPVGYARRELYNRLELGLPPAQRMLSLTGDPAEAEAFLAQVKLPEGRAWIGPAALDDGRHRYLLFFGYAEAAAVVTEIRRIRRTHSAAPPGAARGGRGLRIAMDDIASLQF
ncbi:primosomal protein N' family DNA-binding protein [Nesterenkonia sandarakina]|uniref:Probable replication restart protein PriA n=1 Tax=Nesterenkonia sandarakina TaxID=272918 RepID=A0A2T0YLG2_9MICC|nr:primosomal protein N' [Nesterenkonia sandarakina]PRZ16115.1 replication restart DNA helicase PriA [Nesterenkonia sandarakina]